ncbi:unnamed protein product [Prunus armeniaca]|uniref:Uncharacterized protein n=1 Tax=Prunus armeniaca TaxID=36596 RepID=A0A6J5XNR4_PRUAR|nr:unnamed protein product [Prunus armeniaca]CAB4314077.1 unnamed protein product [Prunus armeniaca]
MHQFPILWFLGTFSNGDSPKLKVNFRIVTAPMGEGPGETHKGLSVSVGGSRTEEVLTKLPETRTMEKALIDCVDVEQQLGLSLFSKGQQKDTGHVEVVDEGKEKCSYKSKRRAKMVNP